MGKNTGKGSRKGAVKKRSQFQAPDDTWVKRDAKTGRILDRKADDKPFKGVSKEK